MGWFGGTFHPTYKKYPEFERLNVPLRMECLYSDVRNQKMEACFYFDTLSKHFRSLVSAVQSTQKLCLVSSEDSPVKGKAFEIHQRQTALDDHIKEIKDGKNNQDKVNKVKKG